MAIWGAAMAQFRDVLPGQTGWIHELARAEVHPDAERILQLSAGLDPHQMVEESTVDFLTELRECFTEFARLFNGYSETGKSFQEVKIYNVAQTAADFMVFRNQVKLVFTNTSHGIIQISFAQHLRGNLAIDGQVQTANAHTGQADIGQPQDLMAQINPFRNITWTFHGERVTPDQVAKFYFAEFVRASRDTRKTRLGNQLLLEQIKSLLQEKGLDL